MCPAAAAVSWKWEVKESFRVAERSWMAPMAKAAAARCEKGPCELLFLRGVLDGASLVTVALEAVGF